MAIDTRDKRASTIQVANPWRVLLPNPSGTVTGRAQLAYSYSGIAPVVLVESLRVLVAGSHVRTLVGATHRRTLVS